MWTYHKIPDRHGRTTQHLTHRRVPLSPLLWPPLNGTVSTAQPLREAHSLRSLLFLPWPISTNPQPLHHQIHKVILLFSDLMLNQSNR